MAENTTKKVAITEKEALEFARDFLTDAEVEEFAEVIEKFDKMIEQRSKKREYKPDTEKRDNNIARGNEFAALWNGETFTAKDVRIALGLEKPQPANAICTTMVKAGLWKVIPSVETVKVYAIA